MTKQLKWISKLSVIEMQNLVKSVDTVLFDVDGVLLHNKTIIPGAPEAVSKLRKLGKQIGFVTNNTLYPIEHIKQNLEAFEAQTGEIVTPNSSFLAYLKKIEFSKDIYVISCELPKKLLRSAGYNVIEYKNIQSTSLEEHLTQLRELSIKTLEICKNVGAVYLDIDMNCNYGSILAAKVIANHIEGVQLLSGLHDDKGPIDGKLHFVGAKYYLDGIERWTNKKAIPMAKPGEALTDVIISKFGVLERSRVLMIGDNIATDIAFGVNSGFKTCLVLSGVTKKDQVENWTLPEELKPNYVASSLGEIYEKIKNI